jgi:hypothetical protein
MLEKRFYAVPPQAFTANGTKNGVVTIANEACQLFKVGMLVYINANTLPTLTLQIKEIDNEGNVQVGPISGTKGIPGGNTGITARTDISAYTVVKNANISADEQRRPDIDWAEAMRAMYDEEPAVAMRSILVDECGDRVNAANPLPVSFSAEFPSTVEIASGDGSGDKLLVNPDGSINVNTTTDSAATPTIFNLSVPSAAVEVSQVLPVSTKKIVMKVRDAAAAMQFAFMAGDSGTNYVSVPRGAVYSVDGILTTGLTVYLQTDKAGQVVEIIVWN